MASKIPAVRRAAAAVARAANHGHADLPERRRDLRAEALAAYVARVVAEAPPLTDEQRERIAALLRAGGASR